MVKKKSLGLWIQYIMSGLVIGYPSYFFFAGGIFTQETQDVESLVRNRKIEKSSPKARKHRWYIHQDIESPYAQVFTALSPADVRHHLLKIAAEHHDKAPELGEHYYEWIAHLPKKHAQALLRLLNGTAPVDWESRIVKVQKLRPHDRMRYLFSKKIHSCEVDDPNCLE